MNRLALLVLLCAAPVFGQPPLGFRTDGTGRYPKADPPLHWGPTQNVVWHIKLTQSNAIPVIVGDKLLTCAEPCVLLCVNKADGQILWQKESTFKEIALTDKEKTQFEAERVRKDELRKQESALEKERSALSKMVKEGTVLKDEAESKIKVFNSQIEKLRALRKELTTFNRYTEPGKGADGFHPTGGYTSPTPVTDGKRIYVIYGNGLAACYDLAGNRLWLKLVEHPTADYGHGASPVLVNDKLLVHFSDLVALNVADGSEAWRVKIPPSHGTAMHARLGAVDVAIHPRGDVIRVSDGALLAKGLGSTGPNSPLVQDGKVYFVHGQVRGYELPTSSDVPAKWAPLWKGTNLKGSGYWFSSPILHEGLIYALSRDGMFSVVDAETGKLVYDQRLELGGDAYPSITLAGKYLYVSSDNGTTLVLQPGREYKELARNSLETFRSSLVFEGKRMYVRTTKGLWCIGE
jgi:outer membrane protein assembly factor BamB